ncbi:MAG: exodeoxyribonuclease VII small subunit [Erysipelotrichales bacterium]|nr:exodeoxyribonuclease VII small subunit [Erysipelotrichales bacterium]
MAKTEEKKFEELMTELEVIVKDLENGNTDLDESIKKYTEAMKIVKTCNDKLKNATEAVNKVLQENGELANFEIESE